MDAGEAAAPPEHPTPASPAAGTTSVPDEYPAADHWVPERGTPPAEPTEKPQVPAQDHHVVPYAARTDPVPRPLRPSTLPTSVPESSAPTPRCQVRSSRRPHPSTEAGPALRTHRPSSQQPARYAAPQRPSHLPACVRCAPGQPRAWTSPTVPTGSPRPRGPSRALRHPAEAAAASEHRPRRRCGADAPSPPNAPDGYDAPWTWVPRRECPPGRSSGTPWDDWSCHQAWSAPAPVRRSTSPAAPRPKPHGSARWCTEPSSRCAHRRTDSPATEPDA